MAEAFITRRGGSGNLNYYNISLITGGYYQDKEAQYQFTIPEEIDINNIKAVILQSMVSFSTFGYNCVIFDTTGQKLYENCYNDSRHIPTNFVVSEENRSITFREFYGTGSAGNYTAVLIY